MKHAIYRCMPEINIMKLIEYIRRWRVDMNFMFEWHEQYLFNIYILCCCSCHENIKSIS